LSRALEGIYEGWDVTLRWDDHTEQDTRSRRTYFGATRATVIAVRRWPASPVGTAAREGRETV
jgi:hypothetical protein